MIPLIRDEVNNRLIDAYNQQKHQDLPTWYNLNKICIYRVLLKLVFASVHSIFRRCAVKPLNLPGPNAKRLIERDQAVISPSYPRGYPFVMDHGKGVEVWDVDGNRFIDFAAGIAVNSTGHSHPKVVKAIQEQAEKFIHISSDIYHPNWI
jgi:hypothetical protein